MTAMPPFIEPQLCKLVQRPPSESGWAHEVKFDGYRMQLRVENGHVQLRTRKGHDWTPKFDGIAKAASALPDCLLDGEIVAMDKQGAPDFAALQAALSEHKVGELIFFAFDVLFIEGDDLRQEFHRLDQPALGRQPAGLDHRCVFKFAGECLEDLP